MFQFKKLLADSRSLEGIAALVELAEIAWEQVQSAEKECGKESIEAMNARVVWIGIKFLLEDYDSVKMSTWLDTHRLYHRGHLAYLAQYYEALRWLIPGDQGPADLDVEKIDAESNFPVAQFFWDNLRFNPMMVGFEDLIYNLRKQGLGQAQKRRILTAALAWMSLYVTFYRDKYPQPNDMTKWIVEAFEIATDKIIFPTFFAERLDIAMDLGTVDFVGMLSAMLAAEDMHTDPGFASDVPRLAKSNDARYVRTSSPEMPFECIPWRTRRTRLIAVALELKAYATKEQTFTA